MKTHRRAEDTLSLRHKTVTWDVFMRLIRSERFCYKSISVKSYHLCQQFFQQFREADDKHPHTFVQIDAQLTDK